MKETHHRQSRCPHCNYLMDTSAGDAAPQADDFALCIRCISVLRYNADLSVRQADPREIIELSQSQPEAYAQIQQARIALAAVNQHRNRSE